MAPQHSVALLHELQDHNDYFDSIVDMIPAKLYVADHSGDHALNSKYFKGQHKESKELKRARTKAAKRAKYDPNQSTSTIETKERNEKQAQEQASQELSSLPTSSKTKRPEIVTPEKKNTTPATISSNKSRIEALRAKLHAKIAENRAQRTASDASTISKRAARRAEKQRSQKEQKKKNRINNHDSSNNNVRDIQISNTDATSIEEIPSPMDDLKHLDFGTLAGLNPVSKDNNKSLKNLNKTKNLEKMLHEAEKKRQKLQELRETNQNEAAQGMLWKDALKEAGGQRVKDNPALLKKLLKKRDAKKKKSQAAWKSRLNQAQQEAQERQATRQANLQSRGGGRLTQATQKKKNRAGFEGRKRDFLNKNRNTEQ